MRQQPQAARAGRGTTTTSTNGTFPIGHLTSSHEPPSGTSVESQSMFVSMLGQLEQQPLFNAMNFSRSIYSMREPDDLRDRPLHPVVPERRRRSSGRSRPAAVPIDSLTYGRSASPATPAAPARGIPSPLLRQLHPPPCVPEHQVARSVRDDHRHDQRHFQLQSRTRSPRSPTAPATRCSSPSEPTAKLANPRAGTPRPTTGTGGPTPSRRTRSSRRSSRSTRTTRST